MTVYAYTSITEVQTAFATLSKLEKRRAEKTTKLQAKIADLTAKHEAEIVGDTTEIAAIRAAIAAYAEANRAELTHNGKSKTASFGTGVIKWRKLPAKVEITGDAADILAALKRRRLSRFIRVKEELDKTAILKEATAIKTPIKGLSIINGGELLTIETAA